jgi:hypothetical protein
MFLPEITVPKNFIWPNNQVIFLYNHQLWMGVSSYSQINISNNIFMQIFYKILC